VAVQGLTVSMIEPDSLAYGRILLFSIPLGILGIWMLTQVKPKPYMSDVY
jgi:hypothetical protein